MSGLLVRDLLFLVPLGFDSGRVAERQSIFARLGKNVLQTALYTRAHFGGQPGRRVAEVLRGVFDCQPAWLQFGTAMAVRHETQRLRRWFRKWRVRSHLALHRPGTRTPPQPSNAAQSISYCETNVNVDFHVRVL
jgi:hypothetical protein